jgi:hypothetical protein
MADEDALNMKPGSHAYSVARLGVGQTHTTTFNVCNEPVHKQRTPSLISERRGRMAHAATSIIGRVREKLPERTYAVSTGLLTTSDNTIYVAAVITRTA